MSQHFYTTRRENHVLCNIDTSMTFRILIHHPRKWLFSVSHPKRNLKLFPTSRFHSDSDMLSFLFLWPSPLQLLSLSFQKTHFQQSLSEQMRYNFCLSFITSNMVEVHIFFPRSSTNSSLQLNPVYPCLQMQV